MRAFRDRAFHATLTPKTASPPLPPLSGRFTRTNLRLTAFRVSNFTTAASGLLRVSFLRSFLLCIPH